jgi:hypothetical protein
MRGRKSALTIRLTDEQRKTLSSRLRCTASVTFGGAQRAWAILLLAEGKSITAAGRQVGLHRRHVRDWAVRFLERGVEGLEDMPRTGRPPVFSPRGRAVSGEDRLRTA